jgi:transcriptional regulator with XRE-family HTH domain
MSESSDRPDYLKIRAARKKLNWTQQYLADKAGYKLGTIQQLEQGKYEGLPCLKACKEALGQAYFEVPDRTGSPDREPLRELYALDDDGRVGPLTKRCYYKIKNATLTIRGTKADLIIEKVTMYDDPSRSKESKLSSHRLEGHGRFVDGSATVLYTVEDQTGRLSWAGVCVLIVLPAGKIRGYWMAAGFRERGRTVLGRLELDRKSLVRKSSEEADGHDQREG